MLLRGAVRRAIEAHARRDHPNECCGLLIGNATTILEAVACPNVAQDPRRRYQIAPEDFFAQITRCRSAAESVRIVGAYHSHPRSAPEPSPTDAAEAFAGFLYVIAGPADGSSPMTMLAYELVDGELQPATLGSDSSVAN